MRFCFAHRRYVLYPHVYGIQTVDGVSADDYSDEFIRRVADMGFDGIEMPRTTIAKMGDLSAIKAFGKRFKDAGIPVVALRVAGSMISPRHVEETRVRLGRTIRYAEMVGAEIVNCSLGSGTPYPGRPGNPYPGEIGASFGWTRVEGSSREASIFDFERTADELRKCCDQAAGSGIMLCAEIHPYTIVDNSWPALLLHGLADRENFGINPDTGNPYWTYNVPEETTEELMDAVAPVSVYWHCKSMMRIYHPENERAVFIRVPLPDGEIDYRYAMAAMMSAGFQGYMALESLQAGDQWYRDKRSPDYAKALAAELTAGNGQEPA